MKDFGSLLLVYLLLASQASCHMMRGNDHHHMMGKMDSEDMMGHDGSMMMGKGQMMEHCPFRIQIGTSFGYFPKIFIACTFLIPCFLRQSQFRREGCR